MTAFDTAWAIVKMPIVPNSIKRVDSALGFSGPVHAKFDDDPLESIYHADFYDPKSGETLPMEVGISDERADIEGIIRDPNSSKLRSHAYAHGHWEQNVDSMTAGGIDTLKPYRRRGYATALYDLMAYALANRKNPMVLKPDTQQTSEAKEMWAAKAPDGYWPLGRVYE